MASINRKPIVHTHEGGKAVLRTPQQELFVLCVSFLNEDSFYETASETRLRLEELANRTCSDTDWCLNLIKWLRGDGGLRTVAQIAAVALVHARLGKKLDGGNRQIIAASIRRPDEGPAVLNAWKTTYGTIPKPVKRGVADALQNLTENGYLKWNGKTEKGQISLAAAIRIVHPQPKDEHQSLLFDFIVNDHENEDRKALLLSLPVIQSRETFNALSIEDKVAALTCDNARNLIKSARLTHETIFSSLGKVAPVDAQRIWLNLIPDMGYQAILMNLRRIIDACGEDSEPIRIALDRIDHPMEAGYEPLPISFLSAYRNVPDIAKPHLEHAAKYSLQHVPELPGRTLVMVDRSGSMWSPLSQRSTLSRYDAASMFACALGLKNPRSVIVPFENEAAEPIVVEGENPLAMLERFGQAGGGTRVGDSTKSAYQQYGPFDRVIVLTDEQSSWWDGTQLKDAIPHGVPLYVWNLCGYHGALSLGDRSRMNLGGLSDAAFSLLSFDTGTKWPWEL